MRQTRFSNEHCSFRPFATTTIAGESFPLGFKVVTNDLCSLNLRKNLHGMTPPELRILKYEIGGWQTLPESIVNATEVDWGGIWCARTPGDGRALYRYYQKNHGPARILVCAMKEPLFAKSDRVKCRGVYPIEEMNLLR